MQNSPTPQKKSPFQLSQKQLYILLAAVVLSIVALCIFVLSLWAKYAFAGDGADSSRVAKFVVEVPFDEEGKSLEINSSDSDTHTQDYTFSVSNKHPDTTEAINEVTTTYDVVITFPSEFTYNNSGVDMTLINDNGTSDTTADDTTTKGDTTDNTTYTFSSVGTFNASDAKTHNLTLRFNLPDAAKAQTGTWEGIKVSATATQVD